MDVDRANPLFEKVIPININDHLSAKCVNLVVRLLDGKNSDNGFEKRLFHLEITDDNNHNFLYCFDTFSDTFHVLKNEKKFNIEFETFPEMLINHFTECLSSHGLTIHERCPLFKMELDVATGTSGIGKLTFWETNTYKVTEVLSLECVKGDERASISYLSSRLNLGISRQFEQAEKIKELISEVNDLKANNNLLQQELHAERMSHEKEVRELQIDSERKLLDNDSEAKHRLDTLRDDLNKKYSDAQAEWRALEEDQFKTIQALKAESSGFLNEKLSLETKLRDLKVKCDQAESDRDRYLVDTNNIRGEHLNALEDIKQLEKDIDKLNNTIETLREKLLMREDKVVDVTETSKKNEHTLELERERLAKALMGEKHQKDKNVSLRADNKRLLEELTALHKENEELKKNIDKKNEVLRRQEATVIEKTKENENSLNIAKDTEERMKEARREISRLEKEVSNLENDIKERDEKIAQMKNTMEFLNDQVNENTLGNVYIAQKVDVLGALKVATSSNAQPSSVSHALSENFLTANTLTNISTEPQTPPYVSYSLQDTSHSNVHAADNFLNNSPVTPGNLVPSRSEFVAHENNVTRLSYEGKRRTITPNTNAQTLDSLGQSGYYNTATSGTHRDKVDRSPPAKTQRSSRSSAVVTPGSTGIKLTANMLTDEKEFSKGKISGQEDISNKKDLNIGHYEWNKTSFA